jgi:hypothetical protein
VVDSLKFPEAFDWSAEDVANWIANVVGLPEYSVNLFKYFSLKHFYRHGFLLNRAAFEVSALGERSRKLSNVCKARLSDR